MIPVYICMTILSFLLLSVYRGRAGYIDPINGTILLALVWSIGLPLGTYLYIDKGIQREQNKTIQGS
jgi:hypothetical protein